LQGLIEPVASWLRRKLGLDASAQASPPPAIPVAPPPDTEPPVPFAPRGSLAPLYFLHIPKTSGSSVNRFLSLVYGADNLVTHAEYLLPRLLDRSEPTRRVDCVSAHVPLCRWSLYHGSEAFGRATILRDPWQRLVSHVNWTSRHNHGEPVPTQGRGGIATQKVVAALAETDFGRREDLQRLFDVVQSEPDFILFDNLQVRMLTPGNPRSDLQRPDQATLRRAQSQLRAFDAIGICEDQAAFQSRILAIIGSDARADPIRENIGQPLALTPDNEIARAVFAPWIELDQALYDSAVRMLRKRNAQIT
jgi:hypothetical protein